MKLYKFLPANQSAATRRIPNFLLLCAGGLLAAAAPLHAQTTYTYVGAANGALDTATNYNPATGTPNSTTTTSDTALFNSGSTNLALTSATTNFGGTTAGTRGALFVIAGTQTGTVSFTPSAGIRLAGITVNAGAGAVTFNGSYNIGGSAGNTTNTITNNSSNTLTFAGTGGNIQAGGGTATSVRTLDFEGTGRVTIGSQIGNTNANISLLKNSTGTLTLGGVNGYTGATTVNAGTLLVNGSTNAGSVLSVNNSGTILGGTGTVGGVITVGSGAILQGGAGAAAGMLTLSAAPVLNSGSVVGLTFGAGNAHSTLALPAGFNGFQSDENFTLSGLQAGTYDNIITGVAASITTSGWTITNGSGYSYSFTDDGSNIDLTVAAVPEPSTWVMSLLGIGLAACAKRGRIVRTIRACWES